MKNTRDNASSAFAVALRSGNFKLIAKRRLFVNLKEQGEILARNVDGKILNLSKRRIVSGS